MFTSIYLIACMYGMFTYIYHKYQPNVGKYTTSPMDAIRSLESVTLVFWAHRLYPLAVTWYQKPQTSLSCHSSHSQER